VAYLVHRDRKVKLVAMETLVQLVQLDCKATLELMGILGSLEQPDPLASREIPELPE